MSGKFLKAGRLATAVFAASIIGTVHAGAANIGVGSTKGGATAAIAAALSKVISAHSGHQLRPQPMGGTQQYIPLVNAGEIEFGLSNAMQVYMAISGTGLSAGKKNSNLRLVAKLMTFRTGMFVPDKSGIKSVAGLKGKRVPGVFSASPLFKFLFEANLANAGLTWNDVKIVPQTALRQHWAAFAQGKIDVAIGAIGSGPIKKANAAVGGVTFLSLSTDAAAKARTLKLAPKTFLKTVKPGKPFVGVKGPINTIHFHYLIWANKDVSQKVVYDVVKAIHGHEKDLHGVSPLWRSHKSATMATAFGPEMQYHPGAVKFYKEKGIWQGK